jgi:prepilin-type processing-associated H-X9-DG protein
MTQPAAPSALLAKPVPAPTYIAVSEDLGFLGLTTAAGETLRLGAKRLRSACKCAHCLRARIDGVFPTGFDGIAITQVSPIGDYAINIAFSDGHARGIYPWAFLLGLHETET